MFDRYEEYQTNDLYWAIRKGTSDKKAIDEVVARNSYCRRDFKIEPGETWIDVGANCGAFSVLAASKGANVIAFEPDPENVIAAQNNIYLNDLKGTIELHEYGLWNKHRRGKVGFYRNTKKGNLWRNSAYKKWQGGETIEVEFYPIDEFWVADNCIKIDAEGAEMPILEDYCHRKVKKLVFEWSFDIDSSITRFKDIINRLKINYKNVTYQKFDEEQKLWPASWFPACRTVWCYD